MELTQMGILDELLATRRGESSIWANNNLGMSSDRHHHHNFSPSGWSFDYRNGHDDDDDDDDPNNIININNHASPSLMELISPPPPPPLPLPLSQPQSSLLPNFDYPLLDALQEVLDSSSSSPLLNILSTHNVQDSNHNDLTYPSSLMLEDPTAHVEETRSSSSNGNFKMEVLDHNHKCFSIGHCGGDNKKIINKNKKLEGQPSKNLMAERRRRKRLNDRLSMLRSIVPKISKMDRTSILGDAIDYMKELLDKINKLQEDQQKGPQGSSGRQSCRDDSKLFADLEDLSSNEALVRNSPKFEVEKRKSGTRVDICCSPKPGLLLSTVSTLESLGMEIQHCVISCFSDFSLQASCSEGSDQRGFISSEDIKQALFRNAGYGGRCL